ncbi:MAG: zinc ribbon domain-containing protein [Oscillospiraceae bacterium]|nr:zinc ribbon domain-containing protein [Oscillospiraceae bacterium]
MGLLEKAIRKGVGDAIGKAVQQVVEPKAAELADKAAEHIDKAAESVSQQIDQATESVAQQTQETAETASGLGGAFASLQRSLEGYATEAAKNIKICPGCGEPAAADKKFCPSCGEALPETTVAQGAVCTECATQNTIGTKFCSECGAKLPAAIQEEEAAAASDAAVMAQWEEKLSQYPKWNCGGANFSLEHHGGDQYLFYAKLPSFEEAQEAVKQYRISLQENGFRAAGEYPSVEHLYKMAEGICWHVDTEHCFDGDSDCPCIGFLTGEPRGGFDYVKPEPKKPASLKDLFGL